MTRVEASAEVNAPVTEVFAYGSGWRRWEEWWQGVSDFRPTAEVTRWTGTRCAESDEKSLDPVAFEPVPMILIHDRKSEFSRTSDCRLGHLTSPVSQFDSEDIIQWA